MSYRLSSIILFIFLAGVITLWFQGFRLYPFALPGDPSLEESEAKPMGISLTDARKISNLKLDFTLFDDPLYKSLQLRQVIFPELQNIPKGRQNPFLPTAGVSAPR